MTGHPIPEAALTQHIAILGKTGSGKTYAAKGMVEGLLDRGERVCIVDPTGVYRGLRSNAAGDGPGFPVVVFGGRHGDLALAAEQGAEIAGIVGTTTTPIVLDMLLMGVGERTRFFAAFAEALLPANRGPLHLVIDEAHLFAPQGRVADPQSSAMVHATNNLVSLGRARGLRITLITQRPAKLHKDSLTQVETLVAMRLIAPQDRKAVDDWIVGQGDRSAAAGVIASLASLPQGEGWVWAPELGVLERVRFPAIRTFDTGRPGADVEDLVLAPIDVAAIRAALAATAPEADRDPPSKRKPGTEEIAAAEQRGFARGYEAAAHRTGAEAQGHLDEIRATLAAFEQRLADPSFYRDESPADLLPAPVRARSANEPLVANAEPPVFRKPWPGERARAIRERDSNLNSAARKMVAVLDTNPPVRRTWTQVASLAGLKASGGHYNLGRKQLLEQAWVKEEGGLVVLATIHPLAPPPPADPAAHVEIWAAVLTGAAPRILRQIFLDSCTTRAAVAQALSLQPRGGHWNAAWKELRSNSLIQEAGDQVSLAAMFQREKTR